MEIAPEIANYLQTLSPAERAKISVNTIHPALASNHVEPDPAVKAEMDFDDDHSFNQPLSIDDLVVNKRTPNPAAVQLTGKTLGEVLDDADSDRESVGVFTETDVNDENGIVTTEPVTHESDTTVNTSTTENDESDEE